MAAARYNYAATNPHITPGQMTAVIWVETVLAGCFVACRTWIRLTKMKKLYADDFFVYLAYCCLIAMTGLYTKIIPVFYTLLDVEDGVAAPPEDLIAEVIDFLKIQFAIIILFWTTIWSLKASFLAFYRGLFDSRIQPWTMRAWWVVVVLCAVSYLGCWITQFLSCVPFQTYFELGACETPQDLYTSNMSLYYSSAVDVACDILIMALPLSILWKLQMDKPRKIALVGMFSVGAIIIVFAVLRLSYTKPNREHVNPEWLCIWSVTECSVAVMVSCAPPFRKLFTAKEKPRTWSTQGRKSGRSTETDEESTAGFAQMHPGHELESPYSETQFIRPSETTSSAQSINKGVFVGTVERHGSVYA